MKEMHLMEENHSMDEEYSREKLRSCIDELSINGEKVNSFAELGGSSHENDS